MSRKKTFYFLLQLKNHAYTKSRKLHPLEDRIHLGHQNHPRTPASCSVLYTKAISEVLCNSIPQSLIRIVIDIPNRYQGRIIGPGEVRKYHSQEDPKVRSRARALTSDDTRAITPYLNNPTIDISKRGLPWATIAKALTLPEIYHFKLK